LNDLTCYYDFEKSPGSKPLDIAGKYDFRKWKHCFKIIEFEEDTTAIVSLVFLIYIVAHVFDFGEFTPSSGRDKQFAG
jgi:hypothetical protein